MEILTLYRQPRDFDAIVAVPGEGEHDRIALPVQMWNQNAFNARHLLVCGHNHTEVTMVNRAYTVTDLLAEPFNLRSDRTDGVVIDGHNDHTGSQALWLCEQMERLHLESLVAYVTPYHLTRWILTFVRTMNKQGRQCVVLPLPLLLPDGLATPSPEAKASMWDRVAAERQKVDVYGQKGDVAGYDEFREYLDWLRPQLR